MNRTLTLFAVLATVLALPASALAGHGLSYDHAPPSFGAQQEPTKTFTSGGKGAKWELLSTFPTANPHTDLDFFTKNGETYGSFGTLGIGANGGGQEILQLTEGGKVAPKRVSFHPSANCLSNPGEALGLQHDVEATPKGGALLNTDVIDAARRDTQLLVDASDGPGRCHDQGVLGIEEAPQGGLEIIDVTDPTKPKEIGLTSHIGEAHTVNIDPRRPHIAYASTSDSVGVDAQGKRANETAGSASLNLDGFEVVNLASCMNFPAGTTVEQKRAQCRPEVYRYRYPSTDMALGHTNKNSVYGCHELEVYPDDRLTCGGGNALITLDMSQAFDDNGTPSNFLDDKPRGTPLACSVRDSSSTMGFKTGAKITDCRDGQGEGENDLRVAEWLAAGAPSLTGVRWLGSAFHAGRESTTGAADPKFDSTEDIDFNHEAELTHSGDFLLATDERGGGVVPPGASCSPTSDVKIGNGGIHAYRTANLLRRRPSSAEDAFNSYAEKPGGGKVIYRAPIRTKPQGSLCTAHVFQQIPGQNRIFMGWYSQGTQVLDYEERADGTLDIKEAGYFIPSNANEWTSSVFKVERNGDGSFTYYGAASDFAVGDGGRNTIDVYKVTLPAPPAPRRLLPGVGSGFKPASCLSRRVKVGPRNIGRLILGQSRARTAKRAQPLGTVSRRTRVLRYCVKNSSVFRSVAVFDGKRRLRLAATNAKGHTRRGIGRGASAKALRRRFANRLGRLSSRLFVVKAPRRSSSRVVFGTRGGKVRFVAIADRKLAKNRRALRRFVAQAKLG